MQTVSAPCWPGVYLGLGDQRDYVLHHVTANKPKSLLSFPHKQTAVLKVTQERL